MWLAISIGALLATIMALWRGHRTSPESNDLTYQIVKAAIKSRHPLLCPHHICLIATNKVVITNKHVRPWTLYVRIENGDAIVSNGCQHGFKDSPMSLAHVDSIKRLGDLIDLIVYKRLYEGNCGYEPNCF